MKFSTILALAFSAMAAAQPVSDEPSIDDQMSIPSDDKPPRNQIRIDKVTWNGSGCPKSTTEPVLNPDATIITLIFNNYTASIGPNLPRSEARKNCQVSLTLMYPSGYQYSIADVTVRGYIDIDAGVTASISSRYYFQGMTGQDAISKYDVNGPFSNTFSKSEHIPIQSVVWSPCGAQAAAQINNAIALTANRQGASGAATIDSQDIKFTQKQSIELAVNWRRTSCGNKRGPAMQKMHVGDSVVVLDE